MDDSMVHSWQVYDLAHYETFSMDYMADAGLTVSLLIPLDNSHRNNGAFRVTVHGGETETVPILVEDIFPCPPDSIKNLYVNVPCYSSSLSFPANSMAGSWQDVESMIRNACKRYKLVFLFSKIGSKHLTLDFSTSKPVTSSIPRLTKAIVKYI
jgi:hypothetical protein